MGFRWFSIKGKSRRRDDSRLKGARRYLRDRLAAGAGLAPGAVSGMGRLKRGTNAYLFVGTVEGWGRVLARFIPAEAGKDKGSGHVHASALMAEAGIPSPRIFHTDLSRATADEFGFHVIVEEFLEGDSLTPALLGEAKWRKRFLSFLIRLHSQQSAQAGRPWLRLNEWANPPRVWRQRAAINAGRLGRGGFAPASGTRQALRRWMEEKWRGLRDGAPWTLVCGDIHPDNFIASPNTDQLYCVDKGTLMFGAFEEDLIQVEEHYVDVPRDSQGGALLRDYFAGLKDGADRAARYEANRNYFGAWRALEKAAACSVKLAKIEEGRKREARRAKVERTIQYNLRRLERFTGIDGLAGKD